MLDRGKGDMQQSTRGGNEGRRGEGEGSKPRRSRQVIQRGQGPLCQPCGCGSAPAVEGPLLFVLAVHGPEGVGGLALGGRGARLGGGGVQVRQAVGAGSSQGHAYVSIVQEDRRQP